MLSPNSLKRFLMRLDPGQIMEELDTKTLLAMSRTCSTFRSLLHSAQGAAAWKCARANTGEIPDLQAKDLEEWMLASLLFDSTCHVRQPSFPTSRRRRN